MDASFDLDKLRELFSGLLFVPTCRSVLFLDLAAPVEPGKKGWYTNDHGDKGADENIQAYKEQESSQYSIECLENQRAGKPFDVQLGVNLLQAVAFHQAKKDLITTPTRIKNRQAPNQPIIAFWVSWSPLCHLI